MILQLDLRSVELNRSSLLVVVPCKYLFIAAVVAE
jgi:hypothetical protein